VAVQILGKTFHFDVKYDDNSPTARGIAQKVLETCEDDFQFFYRLFNVQAHDLGMDFGPTNTIQIIVKPLDGAGASNQGFKADGTTSIAINDSCTVEQGPMAMVAELVEIFMVYNNLKSNNPTWMAHNSDGEGLSQYCQYLRYPEIYQTLGQNCVNTWFRINSNVDILTEPAQTDGDDASTGGTLLFLFFLETQLGFSPADIIQEAGSSPAETFTKLTGRGGGPDEFKGLIERFFHMDPLHRPPLVRDNPFPLLDADQRSCSLTYQTEPSPPTGAVRYQTEPPLPIHKGRSSKLVEVVPFRRGYFESSPLFYCPPSGPFWFTIFWSPQKVTMGTALRGFGIPAVKWFVDGVELLPGAERNPREEKALIPGVQIQVHDAPNVVRSETVDLDITYLASANDTLAPSWSFTLNARGTFNVTVRAEISDQFVDPDQFISCDVTLEIRNEVIHVDPAYTRHMEQCQQTLRGLTRHDRPLRNLIRALPDPPPFYARAFHDLQEAAKEVQSLRRAKPELAVKLEEQIQRSWGISAAALAALAPSEGKTEETK
jgi:hypothetical protein